jgi:osmotically-inducible protein OsmY
MHHQNRRYGSDPSFNEEAYGQQYAGGSRYPGAGGNEFSQFGGPHPAGYRESPSGDIGWNQGGTRAGYPGQRSYPVGGFYPGQGGYRPEPGAYDSGYRGYGESDDYRRGQGHEYDGAQRGEGSRSQPQGYPDYSTPQRGYPDSQYRGQGQNQGQGYGSQDRGNIDSVLDRDWSSYSGSRSQPSGDAYSGQYSQGRAGQRGYGQGSSRQGNYGEPRSQRTGPKGYQRSDERIREQVVERLMDGTEVDLQDVECHVKDGVVTLSGSVKSRHCRQELENAADSIWGVKDVENNLKVKREEGSSASGHTESKPTGDRSGSSSSSQREMAGSSSTSSSTSQQSGNRGR